MSALLIAEVSILNKVFKSCFILLFCFQGKFDNKVDIENNKNAGIYDSGDPAVNECLKNRFNRTKSADTAFLENFNKGQMLLYRIRVTCKCAVGEKCARVLPKQEQGWSEYMGSLSNGYFTERPKRRFDNIQRKS